MSGVFASLIALSLLIAIASRRGHTRQRAADFFVASGQFGPVLFFFLAVGETYSVGSVLGFPGGVVAHGTGFIAWFIGYILLSFPVGYFLYPRIWRAGRAYGAITLPDLFAGHFRSRGLELLVCLTSIAFLVPLGVMQFIGLNTVFQGTGWALSPLLLACIGGGLAFAYIALSGIRAPAYVSVLKDGLVMAAILITGLACLGAPAAPHPALLTRLAPPSPTAQADLFAITTILLQSLGFCVVPETCAAVFTARSGQAIRRAQVAMPLYMLMFPFLLASATFALHHAVKLRSPNDVFLAVARVLLPGWVGGLVLAGAALSALVVLTGICLALGALVTRNLVPGLSDARQQLWSKLIIAAYLVASIAGAAHTSALMIAFNNLFYFGVTQAFPGILALLLAEAGLARRRPAWLIAAGLLAGDAIAIGLHLAALPLAGCNPGFIGLVANILIIFGSDLSRNRFSRA